MSFEGPEGTVSIRPNGTLDFNGAGTFGCCDVAFVHFYRLGGRGSCTRPLTSSERRELGLKKPGPFAQYTEDNPLEFLRSFWVAPPFAKILSAWIEPKTKTIMVRIASS
jgi:hypothetical protein